MAFEWKWKCGIKQLWQTMATEKLTDLALQSLDIFDLAPGQGIISNGSALMERAVYWLTSCWRSTQRSAKKVMSELKAYVKPPALHNCRSWILEVTDTGTGECAVLSEVQSHFAKSIIAPSKTAELVKFPVVWKVTLINCTSAQAAVPIKLPFVTTYELKL